MEELEQPLVGVELPERGHCRMAESAIGIDDHRLEIGQGHFTASEFRDHRESDIGIGLARKRGELGFGEFRPLGGHIKSTVTRKAGEQHVLKGELRGLPRVET